MKLFISYCLYMLICFAIFISPASVKAQEDIGVVQAATSTVVTIHVFTGEDSNLNGLPNVSGSGVIYDGKNGYIVTNCHVVNKAKALKVILADGEEYEGEVRGKDEFIDLAVVKINPKQKLPNANLSIRLPLIDEAVFAVGSPRLKSNTVTDGKVTNRSLVEVFINSYDESNIKHSYLGIQTNALIDHGSSGGGLFDSKGYLIAINSSGLDISSGKNIGWSIPIHDAVYILPYLEQNVICDTSLTNAIIAKDSLSYEERILYGSRNNVVTVDKINISGNNIFEEGSANLKRGDKIIAYGTGKDTINNSLEFQYLLRYSPYHKNIKFMRQRGKDVKTIIVKNDSNYKTFSRLFNEWLSRVNIKEFKL